MPGVTLPAVSLMARWRTAIDDHVIDLTWSPGGQQVAVIGVGGQLAVLSRDAGSLAYRRDAHAFGAMSLSWHPSNAVLATSGADGQVRLWETGSGDAMATLDAGDKWVERVQWSSDGSLLAAAAGKQVRIWNLDLRVVRDFPKHRATVTDLRWQPGANVLCATSYGGVTLLDPNEEKPVRQFSWQGSSLVARWSPDGKYIATGDQDSTVHFWMVRTGKDLQMSGYANKVRELAWDSGSRFLATGGGNEAAVWDCSGKGPSNSKPIILPGHERRISAVAFQHRGRLLATGGDDGRVVVWEPGAKKLLKGATQLSQPITHLAWSADDRDILVGGADGQVSVLRSPQAG